MPATKSGLARHRTNRTGASPHKSISQLKVARCHITLNCHLLAPPHSVRVLKLPACASTSHSWARFSYASAAPEVAALILGSFTWVATERISSARARQCFGSLTSLRSCLFTRTSSLATWPATRRMRTLSFFCGSVLAKMYCSCRPTATARLHQDDPPSLQPRVCRELARSETWAAINAASKAE